MTAKRAGIRPRIGGAVYILPNLLTSGNLFFGYFSIVKSMLGDYSWAAGAILLAAVFDVLDGRVARMTNGTSEFGVQYDSLCDLVSFGLAPAIMMFQYSLNSLGRIGWIICFIFLACGALRLARFNVQSAIGQDNGDFTGLPIPMAAGVIACFMSLMADVDSHDDPGILAIAKIYQFISSPEVRQWFLAVMAPLLGFLMVSNIPYRSHKSLKIKGVQAFRLLAFLVMAFGLVAYKPPLVGFLFFFFYALSGLLDWIMGWKKPTENEEIFESDDENNSTMEPGGENAPRGSRGANS